MKITNKNVKRWILNTIVRLSDSIKITDVISDQIDDAILKIDFVGTDPRTRLRYVKWIVSFIKYNLDNYTYRIDKLNKLKSNSNSIDRYKLLMGDEGIKYYETQKKKYSHSLDSYISKYGYDIGLEKFKSYSKKISNSLTSYIQKYGKKEGEKRYKNFCDKNKYFKSLAGRIEKYGKVEGINSYNRYKEKIHIKFCKASNESLSIFIPLYNALLRSDINDDDMFFGFNQKKEWFLTDDKNIYFYDFTIRSLKIIIEYNGIKWHPRKEKINNWKTWVTPMGESADLRYEKDMKKLKCAKELGYSVLEIFSDEENKLEKCFNYLQQKYPAMRL